MKSPNFCNNVGSDSDPKRLLFKHKTKLHNSLKWQEQYCQSLYVILLVSVTTTTYKVLRLTDNKKLHILTLVDSVSLQVFQSGVKDDSCLS